MNILVVEDDRTNQTLLMFQAEDAGDDVEVSTADDGEEALQRVLQVSVDLIILDLGMPRLDGFGFLSSLRKMAAYAQVPVIVVTARDVPAEDRILLTKHGVNTILQKGLYDTAQLIEEIRMHTR